VEPERLVVGRIAKAHGIHGEVAVDVTSDAPERFALGSRMTAGGSGRQDRELTVAAVRPHQGRLLIRFEEVPDRTAAEALHGAILSIPSEDAHTLPEWSFYPHQLEGLTVLDEQGEMLGRMVRVEENPANDLWIVDDGTREVLVPAVRAIVRAVNVEAGTIVLAPPDGLFDDRESKDGE
jgi:16S rRNA processing protein RimM